MPKELRAELHERFADWLDRVGAEHLAERNEIIGYHLEQAYRYTTELAPTDDAARALALRAGEQLGSAARRAMKRADVAATIGLDRARAGPAPGEARAQTRSLVRPRLLVSRAR